MGRPDEAFGHDRVALIVDLESSAVHEPGPGALDDPALGEDLEAAGVDVEVVQAETVERPVQGSERPALDCLVRVQR